MSSKDLPKRANTDSEKKEVIRRLMVAWFCFPNLRFGQFLDCARHLADQDSDIFNIEDFDLVEMAEAFAKRKM